MLRTHDSSAEDVPAPATLVPFDAAAPAVELPQRHHQPPGRDSQAPFHIGHVGALERLRILIVEDDVTVGPLLAETLEDLGHIVCGVEVDLANAVAASARCRPDLMIVDVGLGEVLGVAAIRQILRDAYVPCVFVTDETLRVSGAVTVRKPFKAADIVSAIHRAMDGPA